MTDRLPFRFAERSRRRSLCSRRWALVSIVLLGALLYGTYRFTHWPLGYGLDLGLVEGPECTVCGELRERREADWVAHAGGVIGGVAYTNSVEAVKAALKNGFRYVELDLRKTLDGDYYGAHKTDDFNEATGRAERSIIPPRTEDLKTLKLFGRFRPIELEALAEPFASKPNRWLVTDKADDFEELLEAFPYPDRLIVEVGDRHAYAAAKLAGLPNVAVATDDPEDVRRYGFELVVVTERHPIETLRALRDAGALPLVASYGDCREVPPEVRRLAALVYVGRCADPAR